MSNFIEYLDKRYSRERRKKKIGKQNRAFACNIPLIVEVYGNRNSYYEIRKTALTKFIYIKNGCRVYFTDADILMMLLQIRNSDTMKCLISNLENAYKDQVEKYYLHIGRGKYEAEGIPQVKDDQVLTNPQDVDISFNDLLVLVNLILSKDRASNLLWEDKIDFYKHTLTKYISLLKYYYFENAEAKKYLSDMGYNVDADIYSNCDARNFFSDFNMFENSGIM